MKEIKDYKKVFETLISETEKYLKSNNLKAMILGISGGIDSTVTAAICHEVEKRNSYIKFIGVSLPCNTNSDEENLSAKTAMEGFCKAGNYWTENLQEEYALVKSICEAHTKSTPISQGNIKARLRMIYLYNLASTMSGLVMDTDNLTEHYLGFFTIHGDVADYNPIGGLWKHEVYELAKYIRNLYSYHGAGSVMVEALDKAIEITPTDGNGVQTGGDMAQIAPGHTYEEVDDILGTYLDLENSKTNDYKDVVDLNGVLERLGQKYGKETVDRVIERHKKSEFKRGRMPKVIERSLYE